MSSPDNVDSGEGEKRKLELIESFDSQLLSKNNFESQLEETVKFTPNKKLCNWRPPIKNDDIAPCNIFNLSDTTKQPKDKPSLEGLDFTEFKAKLGNEYSKENDEFDVTSFPSCSTVNQINESMINYESDGENLSLGSIDTLPAMVFHSENGSITDDKCSLSDQVNEEELEILPMKDDNLKESVNNTGIMNEKFQNQDKDSKQSPDEDQLINDEKFRPMDENITNNDPNFKAIDYQTVGADNTIISLNHANDEHAKQLGTNYCMDDTFDITPQQIAEVESGITTGIYNRNFVSQNNNIIRVRSKQKQFLQKIIKDVEQLNEAVVRATNELKSVVSRPCILNKNLNK